MIIMGRVTRGLGGQAGTHDDYYAINPRSVSGMVEKSKKKPFCDAKFDKKRVFLGDRVLEPQRERSIINALCAPQATPTLKLSVDAGYFTVDTPNRERSTWAIRTFRRSPTIR